jgi:hypothetical protein
METQKLINHFTDSQSVEIKAEQRISLASMLNYQFRSQLLFSSFSMNEVGHPCLAQAVLLASCPVEALSYPLEGQVPSCLEEACLFPYQAASSEWEVLQRLSPDQTDQV